MQFIPLQPAESATAFGKRAALCRFARKRLCAANRMHRTSPKQAAQRNAVSANGFRRIGADRA
jgi:hypothetical protein